jgi:hypothetical protein
MQKFSLVPLVRIVESACRTVLHTGKTSVALFVDAKKAHRLYSFSICSLCPLVEVTFEPAAARSLRAD